ncbi:polysaccharide biosynthesis/export family protein [Devosia sp. SL43]|uniref:polysaccharide biosynthesis/export family protein n=1 Tax=Devosia sp. SL43 TaxID=2806348 RepID=UPI001F021E67|nr:polysaccharide biosynthesis/export family protein [Devosia sp. SL43]UJW87443.1 polysaccharide biosynthesis/export family protein [Devosia sp. SL43]
MSWPFAVSAHAAEPYLLGISDRIAIKVVEWRPGEGDFREWSAVGGEYAIGPTGTVSVPFLGEQAAAGRSTADLAAEFSTDLSQYFGLANPPNVTIEIVAFGPIYVLGDVEAPGEYAYSPGLNVIKALSLAGGERTSESGAMNSERELISARGSFGVLRGQLERLIATRARLDAELAGQEQIAVPQELASLEGFSGIMSVEQAVLDANSSRSDGQELSLSEFSELLKRELATLQQKQTTVEGQLENAKQDLAGVQSLANNGLAANTRVSSTEQMVADLETRLLDIGVAILRTQKDINDTDRSLLALGGNRTADLTTERQQVDAQIADLRTQIATQQSLMADALLQGASGGSDLVDHQYIIIRDGAELQATDVTALQPGDVVKVVLLITQPEDASSL